VCIAAFTWPKHDQTVCKAAFLAKPGKPIERFVHGFVAYRERSVPDRHQELRAQIARDVEAARAALADFSLR